MADSLRRLKEIVDRLRSPGGCPWDLEQTSRSLKPFLLEEAHEVAEAIDAGDPGALCEELGDLLLNVFLQARIGEEDGTFTLADVADGIAAKLVRRHPHVFGDADAADPAAVRRSWEEIKRREKPERADDGVLRPLPASLPALERAQRIGAMAAEVGFDWPDLAGPLAKLAEEFDELREALRGGDRAPIEAEVGDLLLAISSLCRHAGVDGERALNAASERFRRRFGHIERVLNGDFDVPLERMEALWQDAKRDEPGAPEAP